MILRLKQIFVLTITLFTLWTPWDSAQAFLLIPGSTYDTGERPVSEGPVWVGRTVRFYVNTNLTAYSGGGGVALDVTGSEFLSAATDAINAWATACRADLRVELIGTTSLIKNASDETNTISYDNRPTGSNLFASSSIIATSFSALAGDEFYECDIVVNGDNSGDLSISPNMTEIDLVSVLTHEVGHCLGLDHPVSVNPAIPVGACPGDYCSDNTYLRESSMVQTGALSGGGLGDITRRTINQDDIDGIECLYERGKSFRNGVSCSSYHGTSGSGAISGALSSSLGPQSEETPKLCNTDGDSNLARLSNEEGTGCIPAAVGSTSAHHTKRTMSFYAGSVWGFLFLISFLYSIQRLIRKKKSSQLLGLFGGLIYFAWIGTSNQAHATPFELDLGYRIVNPSLWNRFASMNTDSPATWSSGPTSNKISRILEPSVSYVPWDTDWGNMGMKFSFSLPQTQKSTGTPQGFSAATKNTTIWGFRVGPTARYYLGKDPGLFLDGVFTIGQWMASQTVTGSNSGTLKAQAYALEASIALGYEWKPSDDLAVFAKVGYARLNSSYFSASSGSGAYYSDFEAGSRVAVAGTSAGSSEDLKLKASGVFVALGVRFEVGKNRSSWSRKPERTQEPETKTETKATTEPSPEPTTEPSPEPSSEPSQEPKVEPTPEPSPSPESQLVLEPEPAPIPSPAPSDVPSNTTPNLMDQYLQDPLIVDPVIKPERGIDLPPMDELPPPPVPQSTSPVPVTPAIRQGIDPIPDL